MISIATILLLAILVSIVQGRFGVDKYFAPEVLRWQSQLPRLEIGSECIQMTYDDFAAGVQEVLSHLYDAAFLQRHRILSMISEGEDDLRRIHETRRTLLSAIRALRPAAGVPAEAPDWRAYKILHFRYIEGLSPSEAMAKVGLSKSQFFREQARALDLLAQALWQSHVVRDLSHDLQPQEDDSSDADLDRERLAQIEVDRLCASATWQPVEVGHVLADLRPLLVPLAQVKRVEIVFAPSDDFTILHGDPSLLRQVILNLVSYASDIGGASMIEIFAFANGMGQGIRVSVCRAGQGAGEPSGISSRVGVGLEVCRRLMAAMGGEIEIGPSGADPWSASLVWRSEKVSTLLVVDDNERFHHLCRRSLSAYRWQVVGATTGQEARQILAHQRPDAILLDIMMPNEDGWQFLAALKENEPTQDVPVIICSVLNEPELAGMLGASTYLTKPVTQRALLNALSQGDPDHTSLEPTC